MLTRSLAVIAASSLFFITSSAATPLLTAAQALDSRDCAAARVTAALDLPGSQEPVEYTINFETQRAVGDTLLAYNYLIDWTLHRAQGNAMGFSAYYDGAHLRFRDTRLQEYHAGEDVRPFLGKNAVQRQVQFADILPGAVSATLREIATDSAWVYQVTERKDYLRVDATQRLSGYDALEVEITLDTKTHLPLSITKIYNPASISEQEVTYTYQWLDKPCATIDENYLVGKYPDVFAKFRSNNFKAMSLQGQPLPGYALNDRNGVRHTHRRGQSFDTPTIVAFVNPDVVTMSQTIADIRRALASLPTDVAVVWMSPEALTNHEISDGDNETILPAARSMIIDCGISDYPTLLFVNTDGTVANTLIGQNNNMVEVVTQQTLNLK